MMYVIFSLLGELIDVEVRTATGRVDMVMQTETTLYVVEVKLDQTSESAMRQIDLRNYPARFALCGLSVVIRGKGRHQLRQEKAYPRPLGDRLTPHSVDLLRLRSVSGFRIGR